MGSRDAGRGWLAMLAVVVAAMVLLPEPGTSLAWSVGQAVLAFFLAGMAGAWGARGPFVGHALAGWALAWAAAGALAAWLLPAGPAVLPGLLQANWLALGLSGLAVAAGAACAAHLPRQAEAPPALPHGA